MAQNSNWMKIVGTQVGYFILGLAGVRLKSQLNELHAKTNDDTAFVPAVVEKIGIHNNVANQKINLKSPDDLAASLEFTLPGNNGTPGYVLQTDGSGNLSWAATGGSTAMDWSVDSTSLGFGATATVPMFGLPINSVIDRIDVIVDTAFDGDTPQISVGVNGGSASKYVSSTDVDLKKVGRYIVLNTEPANEAVENLEIAYVPSGATVGTARVLVTHSIPS